MSYHFFLQCHRALRITSCKDAMIGSRNDTLIPMGHEDGGPMGLSSMGKWPQGLRYFKILGQYLVLQHNIVPRQYNKHFVNDTFKCISIIIFQTCIKIQYNCIYRNLSRNLHSKNINILTLSFKKLKWQYLSNSQWSHTNTWHSTNMFHSTIHYDLE